MRRLGKEETRVFQIKGISKEYITGDLRQKALDEVSFNLRDNEFVAVLGPSGSGKTTLLNIIGGLDRYDSGDLIIDGISTRQYSDRDWDSYRNHSIGFVFQNYNLIGHQTVLANVELALTISGISREDRKARAEQALKDVGLGEHLHKKPNQLSGGQMQRVAIARALVNNPRVLLADEPTGALDSETGLSVMELLKQVAEDRLVVMVTHNAELAEAYATRIIRLKDGKVKEDSHPFLPAENGQEAPKHKNMGKASMSFLTALSLSADNLRTKKWRTFLAAFAGSIGIIGIALILSLSHGANAYIRRLQKDTMTSYPITIRSQTVDLSSMLQVGRENGQAMRSGEVNHSLDGIYSDTGRFRMASMVSSNIVRNDLSGFKKYLDDPDSPVHRYLGENGIVYSYDTRFSVYSYDPDGVLINTDGSGLYNSSLSTGRNMMMSMMGAGTSGNANFEQLLPGQDDELVSSSVQDNYELLYGSWPSSCEEVVLILDENNEVPAGALFELGYLPEAEYRDYMKNLEEGKPAAVENVSWSYEDFCRKEFFLVPACDFYRREKNGVFADITADGQMPESLLEDALHLKISGVIRPVNEEAARNFLGTFGYTQALTDYLITYAADSEVVQAQKASPEINVLTGISFTPADKAAKVEDIKTYIANLSVEEKASLCRTFLGKISLSLPMGVQVMQMEDMTDRELASMMDLYLFQSTILSEDGLATLYDAIISAGSYEENMESFGAVDVGIPSSISLYVDSFEDKDGLADCIREYNESADEKSQITYTDYVGLLMSSVTRIVNVISYVLIAFVAVSLVVSSIMIGIITFISVLERTKEIGILRAIGASRRNIAEVFNAETFIIGLLAGIIGILATVVLLIPGNMIIHAIAETDEVNAILPPAGAALLVVLSVILTLLGGWIPAGKAAKKDPVAALRTE